MNQSFQIQLQVLKRALADVVMPALEGAENHVVEQVHLSLAVAEFMQTRLPHARRYYRNELRAYASLADAIARLLASHDAGKADELRNSSSAAQTLLGEPEAEWEDYIELTRHIRATVANIVESALGCSYERDLDDLVLTAGADAQLQARIWCAPFGFELRGQDLPDAGWMTQSVAPALSKG